MFSKLKVILLMSTLLYCSFLLITRTRANAELDYANYVKLEAKGKLIKEDVFYAVQTSDGNFPNVKLLVMLERTEDKNRELDRYLEDLKGKTVVAIGLLDSRRVGLEKGILYLELKSQSQVIATEDKRNVL